MSGIETRVSVRDRDGQQHVRISQRVGLMAPKYEAVMYGAIAAFGLGIPGAVISGFDYLVPFIMLAVFLAAVPLVYTLDTKWRAKKQRALDALADDVAEQLVGPAALHTATCPAVADASATVQDARIALPDEDVADPAAVVQRERLRN